MRSSNRFLLTDIRGELQTSEAARAEIMRHIQTLIVQESEKHSQAWNEVARICGFKDMADIKAQGYDVFVDWIKCTITLKKMR